MLCAIWLTILLHNFNVGLNLQVLVTAVAVGLVAHYVCGQAGPAAIVIGNGLALSSTAVVLQVIIMCTLKHNL